MAVAGEVAVADARILIPFSAALRLFAGDDAAGRQVKMEGETELAMVLAKVLQNMTWEYEEDLSQIVGDVAASKIAEFGRKAIEEVKSQSVNMAEMLAEYWQEEKPLLAKKRHVEQFVKEVDVLRDDVERLAKRIEKFERKLAATRQE